MEDSKKSHDDIWLEELASKDIVFERGKVRIVDESELEKKKHWLRNRVTVFVLVGLALTVIGWLAASMILAKVSFGGVVVSARQSDKALQSIVEQQASNYKLAIAYPDGSKKSFSLSDMGLRIDVPVTIHNIRERQNTLSSRIKWWQPTTAYLAVLSNDTERNRFISEHTTVIVQPAKDATLSIKNNEIAMTDSATGKHYGLTDPVHTLNTAVGTLQSTTLQLQTLSTRPAITSVHLAPYQAQLKSILTQSVIFALDTKKFQPTTADIAEWIEVTLNDDDGKKIDVTVNSGKVLAYLDKIAAPFVKPAKAQVEFIRPDGTAAVLFKGVEGIDVIDKSKIAAKVAKDLLDNKAIQENLKVGRAGFNTIGANAYDKWIEVDLANKKMYAYEQSSLVKSFLVSAGAPATPTVTGQFAIYAKVVQQDMRGLNVDGSRYFQPKVSWVNYFYKDYSIHGNYWRPLSWFGRYNSSHGCVGLPNNEAQWIYSWAPKGTPVIIHE